jgi:ATP-binding protein involved in chromosome partitioning
MTATPEAILDALRAVLDPDLNRDIVSLGFVKNLSICSGAVSFDVELTTPACPVKERLKQECEEKVRRLPGVKQVTVKMTSQVRASATPQGELLPQVKQMVAVASGKGGVGKSTTAANIALALRQAGASVGLLDADVYGPSIPMMFGIRKYPAVRPDRKIDPVEAHGIHLMSMGFLSDENTPVIWRGPMVHKLLQQFLSGVHWPALDYLVVDMPPGTGDAQLTLTQLAPLSGAIIVTTPQEVSLIDARKGLKMFQQVKVPVLGIVENMSYFECGHCHEKTHVFRSGGGKRTAEALGVPLLVEVPIDPEVALGGDEGTPIVARNPNSPAARAYRQAAERAAAQLSIRALSDRAAAASGLNLQWK